MFFYRMDYPQFNICMDIDISNFLAVTKANNLSFYYSMIYAVTNVINSIEDFKFRIRDGKIVLHDMIHPSFTDMSDDRNDELFKLVTVNFKENITEFVKAAKVVSENQKDYFLPDTLTGRDDLIYITSIPWISFTHISHTISLNKNDSVPRISWGKYYTSGSRKLLPFSVQVNHALIDGFQIGKYIDRLQTYLNDLQYT